MPKATANINQTQRFELESCPGGYVVIRRLSYGLKLERQEILMKMQMQQEEAKSKGGSLMDISMSSRRVAEFDFKHCVAEHNLEMDDGSAMNFSQPHYVHMLDGGVGEEIGTLIDKVNNVNLGNSAGVSSTGLGTLNPPTQETPSST